MVDWCSLPCVAVAMLTGLITIFGTKRLWVICLSTEHSRGLFLCLCPMWQWLGQLPWLPFSVTKNQYGPESHTKVNQWLALIKYHPTYIKINTICHSYSSSGMDVRIMCSSVSLTNLTSSVVFFLFWTVVLNKNELIFVRITVIFVVPNISSQFNKHDD